MSLHSSLLILYGVLLVGLGIGLAGCLRAIRLLHGRIAESMGIPRRLSVGDRLALPSSIASAAGTAPYVLIFGTASCRSCRRAIDAIRAHARDTGISAIGLWQSDVPSLEHGGADFADQAEAIAALNVGIMPFAVLVENGKVAARGAVGSDGARREFLELLRRAGAEHAAEQHAA